jgi:hypothetical protein
MKYLTTLACALLVSLPAFAQEKWTQEEQTAGLKTYEFTRYVPARKQRALDHFVFLNPDCTLIEGTDIIITKPPEYGSAVLETREVFTNYAKDNVRSKCNEKKMRLPVLIYKAAAGHAGTDMLEGHGTLEGPVSQSWSQLGMVVITIHVPWTLVGRMT